MAESETMVGSYGSWVRDLVRDPAELSFRRDKFSDVDEWRAEARKRYRQCLMMPDTGGVPAPEVIRKAQFDGLEIELLSWQLPYGPTTEAVLLKPAGATGQLPGILALHDHGGVKYFGWEKIAQIEETVHPEIVRKRDQIYDGTAWANECARQGYAVLAHDTFLFGSRRIRYADLHPELRGDRQEVNRESQQEVSDYNRFASEHERVVMKALTCSGTTWPGVVLAEDLRALDYLCDRPDVDANRVGCGGLSGGGLRTVFLAGLDDRVRCAGCFGQMTTWRDYSLYKSNRHTFMVHLSHIARDLDYPEILGMRVPLPTLVLNNEQDMLFSLPEMKRADRILQEVYEKAGARVRYQCSYYEGPHKFDRAMQADAWNWFGEWL